MTSDLYRFSGGVALRVGGPGWARHHFRAEYGDRSEPGEGPEAQVEVDAGTSRGSPTGGAVVRGGHKTARWRVTLAGAPDLPLNCRICLGGRPRAFGLSLVQGYFVEPLLGLAAASAGRVLLPGAAFRQGDGALLVMGSSRAGKTSLAARALAAGRAVLGDDQVLVDCSGRCSAFPRRPRVYSDLATTAPAAYARLGVAARTSLRARALASSATRGMVAPPLCLDRTALGAAAAPPDLPLRRIVVIGRGGPGDVLSERAIATERAVQQALTLLAAQRVHLPSVPAWATAVARAREREAGCLARAFADVGTDEIQVPSAWPAGRAVPALADRLGLD